MLLSEIPNIGGSVDLVFKIMVSVGFVFYIIFAFVIVKQVTKMTDTLEVGLENTLRAFAVLHLLFAIGAFVLALTIL